MDYRLILGSASPRRRELLSGLGMPFIVDAENNFDEVYDSGIRKESIPSVLSRGKSLGFHRPLEPDEVLLTSDTLVLCPDGEGDCVVMGKPHDRDTAKAMLRMLSGRSHKVITAVTVRTGDVMETLDDTAVVHFKDLTDKEIDYYIDKCSPYDKAGAYGIQEWIGYIGIDRIEGSFYTIMGLPVHLVYRLLQKYF